MAILDTGPTSHGSRFSWPALRGRCRRRLVAGLLVMVLAAAYGSWAGGRFSRRGADTHVVDWPVVLVAARLTGLPAALRGVQPQNDRELYLLAVITDQQDVMFGMTLFMLRMIATLTVGGTGIVLIAAGSTEWELRSHTPVS
jgi:hypothetical protein